MKICIGVGGVGIQPHRKHIPQILCQRQNNNYTLQLLVQQKLFTINNKLIHAAACVH